MKTKTCRVCKKTGEEHYKKHNHVCKNCTKNKALERYYRIRYHLVLDDPKHCLTCNMELLPYHDAKGHLVVPKFFCDEVCRNSDYLSLMAKNNIIGRISTGNF